MASVVMVDLTVMNPEKRTECCALALETLVSKQNGTRPFIFEEGAFQ